MSRGERRTVTLGPRRRGPATAIVVPGRPRLAPMAAAPMSWSLSTQASGPLWRSAGFPRTSRPDNRSLRVVGRDREVVQSTLCLDQRRGHALQHRLERCAGVHPIRPAKRTTMHRWTMIHPFKASGLRDDSAMHRWKVGVVVACATLCAACTGPTASVETPTPTPTPTVHATHDVVATVNVESDVGANMRSENYEVGGLVPSQRAMTTWLTAGRSPCSTLAADNRSGHPRRKGLRQSSADPSSTSLLTVHCQFRPTSTTYPRRRLLSIVVGHRDPVRETEEELFSYLERS